MTSEVRAADVDRPAGSLEPSFRDVVRDFLASADVQAELTLLDRLEPGQEPGHSGIYRMLGERAWLAVNWPREYGGLDRSALDAATVAEELALAGIPDVAHVLSIDIVGSFVLMAGTAAQKARFLPALARGEQLAGVLYTEPGIGSDLSALRTTAEREGSGWRISGRKIYSQKSQFAGVGLCAARTADSEGSGITLFMVDMAAAGIRIAPIWNATEERFDDVTLDVRVAAEDVIGPVHAGFEVLNTVLALERTAIDYQGRVRRWFNQIRAAYTASAARTDTLDSRFRDLDTRIRAGRLLAYEAVAAIDAQAVDPAVSARAKWYNTELAAEVVDLGLEVTGLLGTVTRWDGEPGWRQTIEAMYRESPGLTLSAGTSEIMLKVVATFMGLGA
ncbi:acyl-CoA dehydrogenase family protein [Rugosimonospora africana]|uniref:Acyl-CoA dehydrogenase n=1 Tax=Rugosimonospora africana TaxID=556532 RepID=A0A8J3R0N4_9ACTN|nr:acyl-CoA dehydrogenase family protein [Rugosimonospora africana]GIH19418.1 acyl-CoA dehydrogenase [Rugosimonospora africana]